MADPRSQYRLNLEFAALAVDGLASDRRFTRARTRARLRKAAKLIRRAYAETVEPSPYP